MQTKAMKTFSKIVSVCFLIFYTINLTVELIFWIIHSKQTFQNLHISKDLINLE